MESISKRRRFCWRRLLRVPWTARTSNQTVLKEINPEYSLKGLMLKLKLQYFGSPDARNPLTGKRPWCWERLRGGGEGGDRGWGDWMASLTQWTWVWANSERWWRTGILACCCPSVAELDMTKWLNNSKLWNTLKPQKGVWISLETWKVTIQFFNLREDWHFPLSPLWGMKGNRTSWSSPLCNLLLLGVGWAYSLTSDELNTAKEGKSTSDMRL